MEKLVQNRLYKKQIIQLAEDKIVIEETIIFGKNKYAIKYTDLHPEPLEQNKIPLVASGMFLLFALLSILTYFEKDDPKTTASQTDYLLYACLALVPLFFLLMSIGKRYIFISSPFKLIIYSNVPNKKFVNDFIELMLKKRRDYFVNNYLCDNEKFVSKSDEIRKLEWLKKNKIITEEEFARLKDSIINSSPSDFINFN